MEEVKSGSAEAAASSWSLEVTPTKAIVFSLLLLAAIVGWAVRPLIVLSKLELYLLGRADSAVADERYPALGRRPRPHAHTDIRQPLSSPLNLSSSGIS